MKNFTVTTTPQLISERGTHPLEYQNQGTVPIRLQYDGGDGSTLSSTMGRILYPNTTIAWDRKQFPNRIYAITESSTATLHVQGE